MGKMDRIKEKEADVVDNVEWSVCGKVENIEMLFRMKSEKGVALVVVLVLSAVVLAVMTALIYMITSGTQISGYQKRYKTSLEAAKGGSDLFYQVVGLGGDTSSITGISPSITVASSCTGTDIYTGLTYTGFQAKLNTPSSSWSGCNSSITIDPNNSATYDLKLVLGTAPQYNYYAKIVSTIKGNSAAHSADELQMGGVVTSGSGGSSIPVVSKPYLYGIEVEAENSSNPAERSKFSILYQY
jgi:hypothetical protein